MILLAAKKDSLIIELLPGKMIELLSYLFLLVLVLSNTVASISSFFIAEHVDLVIISPTSSLKIFLSKVLEIFAETSSMFFVFAVPSLLAFTFSLDLPYSFALTALLASVPFLLIPVGIGCALSFLIMWIFTHAWIRNRMTWVVLFVLFAYAVTQSIALLEQLEFSAGGGSAIIELVGLVDNPNPMWLPSRWYSSLLTSYLAGNFDESFYHWMLLLSSSLGTLSLAFLVFEFSFLPLRSAVGTFARKKNTTTKERRTSFLAATLTKRHPSLSHFLAIAGKDIRTLLRDRAQTLSLLLYLGIATTYLASFRMMSFAMNLSPVAQKAWWAMLASMNILFAGFIVTSLMTRLVYPSVSREGKAFWLLITAPIQLEHLIQYKFLLWLPLIATATTGLLVIGNFAIGSSLLVHVITIIIGLSMSSGCTALAIGIGSAYASFEWESPTQIATGLGTLVLLLLSLTLVFLLLFPASLALFLGIVPELRRNIGGNISTFLLTSSVLLIVASNFFIAKVSLKKGAQALRKQMGSM